MPTKSVDFPAGLENEIEREVERGRYQSRSELVRDAVRHLLDEQGPRLTAALQLFYFRCRETRPLLIKQVADRIPYQS